ncbi:MAG: ABC transporter substrate-binding protein [Candidatus Bathyarchaeia archaeon]|jgi:ABC-type transport system substrate-binding protein
MSLYKKAITTTRAAIVIAVLLVVIIAGVYLASRPTAPTAKIPDVLVIDDTSWPVRNLNALYEIQYVPWPWWLEHTVYQSLIVPDVKAEFQQGKLVFISELATDWTVSPDGMTYTYNLRKGVTFSDGNPFNSYQVWTQMYLWYYLAGNATTFLSGLELFDLSNVKIGPATFDAINATGLANPTGDVLAMMQDKTWPIYTNGPDQIVFHMKVPFLYLNGLLSGFLGLLFDCQWAMEHGGFGTPAQFNSYFDDHPIPGTGPYVVTEVQMNSYVKFQQNPTYWGKSLTAADISANPLLNPGQVKNVVIYAKTDDIARYTDLTTGAAQLSAIKATNFKAILNSTKYAYFAVESTAQITAVAINTKIAPTNNTDVRRAIVHAINYQDIWNKAYFGQAAAFLGPETPNYGVYYDPGNLPPYDYNVTEAKDYLAKAGYPNGNGLTTLNFRIVSGCSFCKVAAEIVQSNLADIGIKSEINEVESGTYWGPYGNYQTNLQNAAQLGHLSFLGGMMWAPSAISPTDYWTSFVSTKSLWGNWAVYSNDKVDQAVATLASSGNPDEIVSALKVAQQQIYDDAPYAWIAGCKLWYVDGSFVWDKSVIKEVWFDPAYNGINTAPLFNTVIFA